MRFKSLHFLIALFIIASCTESAREKLGLRRHRHYPDYALESKDIATPFDSNALHTFLDTSIISREFKTDILDFYRERDFRFAWFDGDTLSNSVFTFYNMQDFLHTTIDKIPGYAQTLESLTAVTGNAPGHFPDSLSKLKMEYMLTAQFFLVAKLQYNGVVDNDKELQDLEWFIPRRKKNYQVLLDSLVSGADDLKGLEPVSRQYVSLKNALEKYYILEKTDKYILTKQQPDSLFLHRLRVKLYLRGDISDSSGFAADEILQQGIINYKLRYGLKPDKTITDEFISKLNRPVQQEIKTILINMERMRWVPREPAGIHFVVNIPEYKLHCYKDSALLWDMNVVVGKQASQTTIFNGLLSSIVFSPYWNIPQSIIVNELLPELKKDPAHLDKKNMQLLQGEKVIPSASVNWNQYTDEVPFQVRQKPGPGNSLGKVKFLFPNQYAIYFHDTPARELFKEQDRSFSHGCIRLADPVMLASFLLSDDPLWDKDAIVEAMNASEEKTVMLKNKIPVMLGYFTAWVDERGKLNFREDIYDHDSQLARELFN